MGIKNLNQFLKKRENCIKEINIKDISNKKIAVDTSIYLYKYKHSNKLLDSFIQQIYHFKKYNIELIYVFDGKPPKEKQNTLVQRKEVKDKYNSKILELEEKKQEYLNEGKEACEINKINNDISIIKKKFVCITKEDIINLKELFDKLKVKYIQCDCEADLVCAQLYKDNIVDGCLSNDMDFLTFGTGLLYRNYSFSDNFLEYNLEEILKNLNLTKEQFIDFCILCGCDYTNKIPRLGCENAYKLIQQYNTIENILLNVVGEGKKYKMKDEFDYMMARTQFNNTYHNQIDIFNNDLMKIEYSDSSILEICNDNIFYNVRYNNQTLKEKLTLILS